MSFQIIHCHSNRLTRLWVPSSICYWPFQSGNLIFYPSLMFVTSMCVKYNVCVIHVKSSACVESISFSFLFSVIILHKLAFSFVGLAFLHELSSSLAIFVKIFSNFKEVSEIEKWWPFSHFSKYQQSSYEYLKRHP